MKHLHFDVETGGFYGAYWACAGGQKISEGMPPDSEGHRKEDVPGTDRMERSNVRCV